MIVRDEERFLREALASVQGEVDELCIVDTGSTDGTVAIAEAFGATVRHIVWNDDFAVARNASLALATNPWIFVLDADERLAEESRAALRALRETKPNGRGRWITCHNLSDTIRGSGTMSNAIVRIFPNDSRIRYRNRIHEFVARDGDAGGLPADASPIAIVHHGYLSDVIVDRAKTERNLRLSRAAVDDDGADAVNLYNFAMSAMFAGDRAAAFEALTEVCRITAGTPRGFRPQALVALSSLELEFRRDPAAALATAEICLGHTSTYPDAHHARGKALAQLGRLHEARDAFGAAIAAGAHAREHFIVDDEIAVWKAPGEIGLTLMRENRHADAIRWFDLALAQRPAIEALVLNRARCAEALGDLEAALVGFRAAFETFFNEASSIEYVNFVLRHGSADIAATAVDSALPALGDPYRRVFLGSMVAVYLQAGRTEDADRYRERVLAVGDPAAGRATLEALACQFALPPVASSSIKTPVNWSNR